LNKQAKGGLGYFLGYAKIIVLRNAAKNSLILIETGSDPSLHTLAVVVTAPAMSLSPVYVISNALQLQLRHVIERVWRLQ
jgi:hypothetical protein